MTIANAFQGLAPLAIYFRPGGAELTTTYSSDDIRLRLTLNAAFIISAFHHMTDCLLMLRRLPTPLRFAAATLMLATTFASPLHAQPPAADAPAPAAEPAPTLADYARRDPAIAAVLELPRTTPPHSSSARS